MTLVLQWPIVVADSKSFILGLCWCGCGERIGIKQVGRNILLRYRPGHNAKGTPLSERAKRMCAERWKGPKNPNWNNGIAMTRGYVRQRVWGHHLSSVDGFVRQHRLIWEEANNACLLKWAHVHHINRKKDDNRPKNLAAMMKSEHMYLHAVMRKTRGR